MLTLEQVRARAIQERILALLLVADAIAACHWSTWQDICSQLKKAISDAKDAEVNGELTYLTDMKLALCRWEGGDLFVRIGAEGRDFLRAGLPWGQLDRFAN